MSPRMGAVVALIALSPTRLSGQDVVARVVDTGAALCVVVSIPGDHYFVYDAGYYAGHRCVDAVDHLVQSRQIDLFVLSHSDSDHLGNGAEILSRFEVSHVVWTGDRRPGTNTWVSFNEALGAEVSTSGATVRTLKTAPLTPGESLHVGEAVVTFVAGWGQWTESKLSADEMRNVISVVVRLDYRGHSILFAGDAVGRRRDDPPDACKDSEAFMVANDLAGVVPLHSDVLIAPHHGAENASSTCFIERVAPEYVVFSAGHRFEHPRDATVKRYQAAGIPDDRMFRTDLGDDEGGSEWPGGRIPGCKDPAGDDDVVIILPAAGAVRVSYRTPHEGCEGL